MRLDLDPWAIFGCNIAKWTILCIVVHFQPVIKLLQKGVRVHQKRVILMQKMQNFSGDLPRPLPQWGRRHPLPTPKPPRRLRRLDLNPPILKFCLRYWIQLLVHWPLMGGLLHLYSEEGAGWAAASPSPLLAVPNVTSPPINGQYTNFM